MLKGANVMKSVGHKVSIVLSGSKYCNKKVSFYVGLKWC